MKNKEEMFVVAFMLVGLTVIEFLLLGAVFRIHLTSAPIWSSEGLSVLSILGVSLLGCHLFLYRQEVKKCQIIARHIFAALMAMILIFFAGILCGSVVVSICGYNVATLPLWSDNGSLMALWVPIIGWLSGYLYRKVLNID